MTLIYEFSSSCFFFFLPWRGGAVGPAVPRPGVGALAVLQGRQLLQERRPRPRVGRRGRRREVAGGAAAPSPSLLNKVVSERESL